MNPQQREQYLQALGIDHWVLRGDEGEVQEDQQFAAAQTAGQTPPDTGEIPVAAATGVDHPGEQASMLSLVYVGPGSGNILLLCGSPGEAATRLAADVARCLDTEPVWAWPAREQDESGITVAQAISDRLFTRVLSFGLQMPAAEGSNGQEQMGTAQWLQTDSLEILSRSGAARKSLWDKLSVRKWCRQRAS